MAGANLGGANLEGLIWEGLIWLVTSSDFYSDIPKREMLIFCLKLPPFFCNSCSALIFERNLKVRPSMNLIFCALQD